MPFPPLFEDSERPNHLQTSPLEEPSFLMDETERLVFSLGERWNRNSRKKIEHLIEKMRQLGNDECVIVDRLLEEYGSATPARMLNVASALLFADLLEDRLKSA